MYQDRKERHNLEEENELMMMRFLQLLIIGSAVLSVNTAESEGLPLEGIAARDGDGRAVAWWTILKLPMHTRVNDDPTIRPTPCDCPPPACDGGGNGPRPDDARDRPSVDHRATGLCYLYADARDPTLRYFRELGYDCLGQGGRDPLSRTLAPIYYDNVTNSRGDEDDERRPAWLPPANATYWAIFNDQLHGLGPASRVPAHGRRQQVCGGGDKFSAHAKGAVAFSTATGDGVYLQTSTPNFPVPPPLDNAGASRTFSPLGCQRDNNVEFAQHLTALSMGLPELNDLGRALQAARLCSANFYPPPLRDRLASATLRRFRGIEPPPVAIAELVRALLDPDLPVREHSAVVTIPLRAFPPPLPLPPSTAPPAFASSDSPKRSSVFDAMEEDLNGARRLARTPPRPHAAPSPTVNVTIIVKSPRAAVPPWAIVAEALDADLTMATWWDGGFGIPNVCAGDAYRHARLRFCLEDPAHNVTLTTDGAARYNLENLLEAAWTIPGAPLPVRVRWHLVGGSHPDGNHGKWGLTTPRPGHGRGRGPQRVIFGDLNMEGFPCSATCSGSQAGRGGSFLTLESPELHRSLASSLITRVCRCQPPPTMAAAHEFDLRTSRWGPGDDDRGGDFERLRMCHGGCWRKVESHFTPDELPMMTANASSFWNSSFVS